MTPADAKFSRLCSSDALLRLPAFAMITASDYIMTHFFNYFLTSPLRILSDILSADIPKTLI